AEREPGEMVEEIAAQADRHLLAEPGEAADEPRLQDPADRGDAEVDDDDDGQVVRVAVADALVDRAADEQPAAGLACGVARRDEHHQRRAQPPSLQVTQQPPHAATSSPNSDANAPPARNSCAGVPDSTMR